jgi:hypothetical protein
MSSIKTTKRDYLFTVQKRVGKSWLRITDAVFTHRKVARELSNELNNISGVTGRGPNRRYRVAVMRVVSNPVAS